MQCNILPEFLCRLTCHCLHWIFLHIQLPLRLTKYLFLYLVLRYSVPSHFCNPCLENCNRTHQDVYGFYPRMAKVCQSQSDQRICYLFRLTVLSAPTSLLVEPSGLAYLPRVRVLSALLLRRYFVPFKFR